LGQALPGGFNYATSVANTGAKNSGGTAANVANELAYYAQLGFAQAAGEGRLELGFQLGYLPDLLSTGPITVAAGHVFYEDARWCLLAEYVTGWYARLGGAAEQKGFMIEPCLKLTKEWELVLRYSNVQSDGLGLSPGALIRNASSTGTFDNFDSIYVGGNYYFIGNAVRATFGYEYGKATDRLSGTAEENTINGVRTRFQFLF